MGGYETGGRATGVTTDIRKPTSSRTRSPAPSSPRAKRAGPSDGRATRRTQTR